MAEKLFDTLVIEIQKDGKSLASIALDHDDMKGLEENFGQTPEQIIANMIQTLEDSYTERLQTEKK
jgi:hypothetical protein